jgi:hypothetical protein
VALGASLALGTSGAVAKLLALPVFCALVIAVRILSSLLSRQVRAVFEVMLGLKMILLIVGAAPAVRFARFHDGDSWAGNLDGNGAGRRNGDPERRTSHLPRRRAADGPYDRYDDADHD